MRPAEGTAQNGEVLAENADLPSAYGAVARDDSVTGILICRVACLPALQQVKFLKGSFVKQQLYAFAGRKLALPVLRFDPPGTAALECLVLHGLK